MNRQCNTCRAWQPKKGLQGECRFDPPATAGWPKTAADDWCCKWSADDRPKASPGSATKAPTMVRLGINYVFVRDHPEEAASWLKAARDMGDAVPDELRPLIEFPLDNPVTSLLPNVSDNGTDVDGLCLWAEKIPGYFIETERGYTSLLIGSDEPEDVKKSMAALTEIPADHPWRKCAAC